MYFFGKTPTTRKTHMICRFCTNFIRKTGDVIRTHISAQLAYVHLESDDKFCYPNYGFVATPKS